MYIFNLAALFAEVVRKHGERPAIRFGEVSAVSYRELDALSSGLAAAMAARVGVHAGDVVCVSGDKSKWSYAALLACLKLGAPYVMLDPEGPFDRLERIFGTCRPRLVIGSRDFLTAARVGGTQGEAAAHTAEELAECDERLTGGYDAITGDQPAYIMYTSGSTGIPKGAVISHANVLNFIEWSRTTYSISEHDVLTNVNPLYFDNSVFDIYSALFTGASLVPFTKKETRDPGALVRKINAFRCTIWFSVPSMLIFLQTMKATDGRNLRSITRCLFGGEGYPKGKLVQLFRTYSDSMQFFNVYGPTECTCICSSYRLSAADFENLEGLPSLGDLAPNFNGIILDEDGRSVSIGEIGELCLLGPNVGMGYYNDPERTAAAFVQNPVHTAYREIMYRTGDLVRRDAKDGKLYIQGRRDNQVKHMGYRIELEEIEAALHRLDYVAQAAMLHSTESGLSRLTAYIVLRSSATEDRVRTDLRGLVPDYMIPSSVQFLQELPKNANGKVDRRRLKADMERSDEGHQSAVGPLPSPRSI